MGIDKKQVIKCDVYSCKYCNCDDNLCNLKAIKISECDCGNNDKEATICDSYIKRK